MNNLIWFGLFDDVIVNFVLHLAPSLILCREVLKHGDGLFEVLLGHDFV